MNEIFQALIALVQEHGVRVVVQMDGVNIKTIDVCPGLYRRKHSPPGPAIQTIIRVLGGASEPLSPKQIQEAAAGIGEPLGGSVVRSTLSRNRGKYFTSRAHGKWEASQAGSDGAV